LVSSRVAAVTSATTLLLLLAGAAPAGAIFNGQPDGNGHPNVAAVLAAQAFSDGTWTECTGTLISPTVVLSAAHCPFDDGESVAVTFDSEYHSATGTTFWGTWHPDPRHHYSPAGSVTTETKDPHDMAVIVFDSPIPGITPAQLPEAGSLGNLDHYTKFTSVGYGGQFWTKGGGTGKVLHFTDIRYVAVGSLNTETKSLLKISQNPSLGNGGTCTADSGGPNFLGAGSSETNILAASTVTGDSACKSTNVDYRLDTDSARWFLGQYVDLP
jgi:hypothetical protein